jgi:Leucine-rich repeat (LRR) protein/tetratricopeptide (TPR) repeat protein
MALLGVAAQRRPTHTKLSSEAFAAGERRDSQESDSLYAEAWSLIEQEESPRRLLSTLVYNWANSLKRQERPDKALEVLRRFQEWCLENFGPNDAVEGTAWAWQLTFLEASDALDCIEQALQIWSCSLGVLHREVAVAFHLKSQIQKELGLDHSESLGAWNRACEFQQRVGGSVKTPKAWRKALYDYGLHRADMFRAVKPDQVWDLNSFRAIPEQLELLCQQGLRIAELFVVRGFIPDGLDFSALTVHRLELAFGMSKAMSHFQRVRELRSIKMSGAGDFPDSLSPFTQLEVLEGPTEVQTLPEGFGKLPLKRLILSRNRLRELPESFRDFTQLEELDLSGCLAERLPDLGRLTQIKHLRLRNCPNLLELPNLSASRLETLECDHCPRLGSIPSWLSEAVELKELKIGGQDLESLPDLSRCQQLKTLRIVDSPSLTELPSALTKLLNLEVFSISDAPISELPKDVALMTNLREFHLRNGRLRVLPENGPPQLRKLTLVNHELTAFPAGWLNEDLEELKLSKNRLSHIPDFPETTLVLSHLDLSQNQLESVPASLANLRDLSVLELAQNSLSAPLCFSERQHLFLLDLRHNQYACWPIASHPGSVSWIMLLDNKLESIDQVLEIPNLSRLDLGENLLSSGLENLMGLTELSELDLGHNRLTHFPDALAASLPKCQIRCEGNLIS